MMNESKKVQLLLAVLFIAFTVIAFVIPFPKTIAFWIAYLFGAFAILVQFYIFSAAFNKRDAKSRFYSFPIARLGIIYLIIQLIASIIEISLAKYIPVWIIIVVNILILAFALIGCITAETMRNEINRQDEQLKQNVSNMRELQSLSSSLADQCNDEDLKKELTKLAEEFRYSDPISSDRTSTLEADLHNRIRELQQAITDGDVEGSKALCSKISGCLQERNRICALNK